MKGDMISDKIWIVLNVSLSIVAIFLILNLFNINFPSVGNAQAFFDKSEPICIVDWKNELTPWNDLEQCCFQVRQQLRCKQDTHILEDKHVNWVCSTGPEAVKYWLNNKAYYSCEGIPA